MSRNRRHKCDDPNCAKCREAYIKFLESKVRKYEGIDDENARKQESVKGNPKRSVQMSTNQKRKNNRAARERRKKKMKKKQQEDEEFNNTQMNRRNNNNQIRKASSGRFVHFSGGGYYSESRSETEDVKFGIELVEKIITERGSPHGFIDNKVLISILMKDYGQTLAKRNLRKLLSEQRKGDVLMLSSSVRNCCGYIFLNEKLINRKSKQDVSKYDMYRIVELVKQYGVIKKSRSERVDGSRVFRKLLNIALLDCLLFYIFNIGPSLVVEELKGEEQIKENSNLRLSYPKLRNAILKHGKGKLSMSADRRWIFQSNEEEMEGVHTVLFPENQKRPKIEGLEIVMVEEIIQDHSPYGFMRLENLLEILKSQYHDQLHELTMKDLRRFIADGRYEKSPFFYSAYVFLHRSTSRGLAKIERSDLWKIVDVIQRYGKMPKLPKPKKNNKNKKKPIRTVRSSVQQNNLSLGLRLIDILLMYIYHLKPRATKIENPPVPYYNRILLNLVESEEGRKWMSFNSTERRIYLTKKRINVEKLQQRLEEEEEEVEGEEVEEVEGEEESINKNYEEVDVTLFGFGRDFPVIVEEPYNKDEDKM